MTHPSTEADLHTSGARPGPRSWRWWVHDRDGNLAIAMFPNPAIWVWLVARGLAWTGWSGIDEQTLRDVGTGALLVWAADELARGASPFRRVLGAGVLAFLLVGLFR